MIDWKKEYAHKGKNYCGYCIGSPPSANCDGNCFKESDEEYLKYRYDFLKTEIQIAELRVKELKEEFEKEEYQELKNKEALSEYEYEMFFDDDSSVSIHGWYPIATDRIRDLSKIDEYIKKGLLRKIIK